MEDKPEASIPFATGGIARGALTGVIGYGCGLCGFLIPPAQPKHETPEPYDERDTLP